jgi:hypothetical protein
MGCSGRRIIGFMSIPVKTVLGRYALAARPSPSPERGPADPRVARGVEHGHIEAYIMMAGLGGFWGGGRLIEVRCAGFSGDDCNQRFPDGTPAAFARPRVCRLLGPGAGLTRRHTPTAGRCSRCCSFGCVPEVFQHRLVVVCSDSICGVSMFPNFFLKTKT